MTHENYAINSFRINYANSIAPQRGKFHIPKSRLDLASDRAVAILLRRTQLEIRTMDIESLQKQVPTLSCMKSWTGINIIYTKAVYYLLIAMLGTVKAWYTQIIKLLVHTFGMKFHTRTINTNPPVLNYEMGCPDNAFRNYSTRRRHLLDIIFVKVQKHRSNFFHQIKRNRLDREALVIKACPNDTALYMCSCYLKKGNKINTLNSNRITQ